jgi:hypothetical protein
LNQKSLRGQSFNQIKLGGSKNEAISAAYQHHNSSVWVYQKVFTDHFKGPGGQKMARAARVGHPWFI